FGTAARPDSILDNPGRLGYYLFVSMQYYFLGMSALTPRMVNSLGGALMVVYAYRLGTAAFGREEGRLAAGWVACFPSPVLWSALNLRDIWLALTLAMVVFHAQRLRERFSLVSLAMIFLGIVWVNYNRFYLVGVLVVIVLSILLVGRSGRIGYTVGLTTLFVVGVLALYFVYGVGESSIETLDLATVNRYRRDMGREATGRSAYLGQEDITNPFVLVAMIPVG